MPIHVVTVIALMWEYIDKTKYDIKDVIIKFLSRIGYSTSASIIDKEYDRERCNFGNINSAIDRIMLTISQSEYEISVTDKTYLLTDFQKRIWDSFDDNRIIGISAPTSAGKSFVILLKMVQRLCTEKIDIVYIVPTLSLLSQVTEDFDKELKKNHASNYLISNSLDVFEDDYQPKINHIYVLTQEKAISALYDVKEALPKQTVLIVDEIQNIERIQEAEDERSKTLYDTITEFIYIKNVIQVVISGPRIDDIGKTSEKIFGENVHDITTLTSPVLGLTYSISKSGKKFYMNQYCGLCSAPNKIQINEKQIKGYGQKRYTSTYMSFFNKMVTNLGSSNQNIIFAPTSNTARTIACNLTGGKTNLQINDLIDYYKSSVHKNYKMCDALAKDIAYHHGKLPMHVRRTIEYAVSQKLISNVVCTTTLMQGVNLPAQNIFIRNPHLYINKRVGSQELSTYEMANLRGRAGRLLKDFIGRTYVMDESEFIETDEYEQLSLFQDATKNLPSGYGECFEENKDAILTVVNSLKTVNGEMGKTGFIVSYIRQAVLRHGKNSADRMRKVGIKLTQKQVAAIIKKLDGLTVPKDVCLKNRYWDPFVLESIYQNFHISIPKSPAERGAKTKLDGIMRFLRDNNATSYMYKKYIPDEYRRGIKRSKLCKLAIEWSKERKLIDILNDRVNVLTDPSDEIEEIINALQNVVSYNIPLLIKPIFDMINPDSIFLLCMQAGAINNISRTMIEMGIPRETALYIFENYKSDLKIDQKKYDEKTIIRNCITNNYSNMPWYIQVQVNYLM